MKKENKTKLLFSPEFERSVMMELTNKYLREEYNVGNWVTYEKLLKDYYGKEPFKCGYCQLCMPAEDTFGICIGAYYGEKITKLKQDNIDKCEDWELSLYEFMQLGESNKYPELNEYLNRPWL